jgi:hypothetical protein
MSNLYRGPSIDASYQVSYHLANDVHNLSDITNVQSKIYHKIYLGIIYIANEAY